MPSGKHVLRNAYIAINGTALSDHASSLEVEDEAEEVEFTGFSPNGYREFGQGLKDATPPAAVRVGRHVRAGCRPVRVRGGVVHEPARHDDQPHLQLRRSCRRGWGGRDVRGDVP
jgi:hypothetical protein